MFAGKHVLIIQFHAMVLASTKTSFNATQGTNAIDTGTIAIKENNVMMGRMKDGYK